MEGTSVGAYRIERKIGEGGMGTVWVGQHTLLGRLAAIKVLLPEYTSNEEIVQRFFNEARAVTAIADPGIVQVFDFGYANGSAYIVMELLDGEAMDARLRRIGRFAPIDAIRLMTQVATSLGAAHARGVIHRDLKPENIFIVGDPAVTGGERSKVLDFGIAKLAGDESSSVKTQTGMVMGTPFYMSPEQCRGEPTIDARSDVYALGCVLFTMLCGRPPFESDASGYLIVMHVRDVPPPPSAFEPSLSPEIDALIARCLEKDPNRRFQTTAELVQGLAAVEAALLGAPVGGAHGAAPRYARPASHDALTHIASVVHGTGPAPTTLSLASGAVAQPRRKGALLAGLAIGALAIGGGVLALVTGVGKAGDDRATASAPPIVAPADGSADTRTVAETPAVVIDAGVPDAQATATEVAAEDHVDAGVAATTPQTNVVVRKRDKRRPSTAGGTKQGGSDASTGSASATINRGD